MEIDFVVCVCVGGEGVEIQRTVSKNCVKFIMTQRAGRRREPTFEDLDSPTAPDVWGERGERIRDQARERERGRIRIEITK